MCRLDVGPARSVMIMAAPFPVDASLPGRGRDKGLDGRGKGELRRTLQGSSGTGKQGRARQGKARQGRESPRRGQSTTATATAVPRRRRAALPRPLGAPGHTQWRTGSRGTALLCNAGCRAPRASCRAPKGEPPHLEARRAAHLHCAQNDVPLSGRRCAYLLCCACVL